MGQQGWQVSCPVPRCRSWAAGGSQGQPRVKNIRHIHSDEVRGTARKVRQQGRSGSGPGTATRVSHSLRITRQVHNDGQRPLSSWEVGLWAKVQVQITGVNGQAQAWLLVWPGPSSKTSTHSPEGMARPPCLGTWQPLPHRCSLTCSQANGVKPQHTGDGGGNRGVLAMTHFLFGGSSRTPICHRHRAAAGLAGTLPSCCSKLPSPQDAQSFCLGTMSDVPGRACCTPLSCGPSPALLPGSHSAPSGLASPSCTSSDWI